MKTHLTFADISVYGMFVTGPAETLLIKLDYENASGGRAVIIENGGLVWVPANRIVLEPKNMHFVQAGQKYLWERTCDAARVEHSRLAEETSKY